MAGGLILVFLIAANTSPSVSSAPPPATVALPTEAERPSDRRARGGEGAGPSPSPLGEGTAGGGLPSPALPQYVEDSTWYVTTNRTAGAALPRVAVAQLTAEGHFVLPAAARTMVIEVGTNDEPEMTTVVAADKTAVLVAVEARLDAFVEMRNRFPAHLRPQLIAVPAAITNAPGDGFVRMNVGGHRGCSSLLPQSARMRRYAAKEKTKARKKSQAIQLRTVEWCAMADGTVETAAVPLSALMAKVPPAVTVALLMTDAQGFDIHVVATLPKSAAQRVAYVVMECQDLAASDRGMLLVDGAMTCAEQRTCFSQWFPHQLEYCWFNAPKVRELNCLYSHPVLKGSVKLPKSLKLAAPMNITYEPRQSYDCPASPSD